MLVCSKTQSFNYVTKLTPTDCPILPDLTGSYLWFHVPISSPLPQVGPYTTHPGDVDESPVWSPQP